MVFPEALNSDGSVMAGFWDDSPAGVRRGFVWRYGQPPVSLGHDLAGTWDTEAFDVSEDGRVVVGSVYTDFNSTYHAMIWRDGRPELLADYLTARGVTLPAGTNLRIATSVSADGQVFAGLSGFGSFRAEVPCYANCDGSTTTPVLNVQDFVCFMNLYAAPDSRANCDESTTDPWLNVNDFICFMGKYAAGCR